ncbi:hypothetical protein Bbelb_007810 [Branchiostoma belcheri]|nr:hypothetical protein Bbelb_007810 [Branchiostoma belcheri]
MAAGILTGRISVGTQTTARENESAGNLSSGASNCYILTARRRSQRFADRNYVRKAADDPNGSLTETTIRIKSFDLPIKSVASQRRVFTSVQRDYFHPNSRHDDSRRQSAERRKRGKMSSGGALQIATFCRRSQSFADRNYLRIKSFDLPTKIGRLPAACFSFLQARLFPSKFPP